MRYTWTRLSGALAGVVGGGGVVGVASVVIYAIGGSWASTSSPDTSLVRSAQSSNTMQSQRFLLSRQEGHVWVGAAAHAPN